MTRIYESFRRSVIKHEARRRSALPLASHGLSGSAGDLAPALLDRIAVEADEHESAGPVSGFRLKEYAGAGDEGGGDASGDDAAAPATPPIKTGGWNDTRNDVNADGKYLLLAVPEFKPGMSTYLRLGAACSSWDVALGNELEKAVHLTGPVGKTTDNPFIDDERERGGATVHPGVGATLDESAILHTKGGWRDHSDGNRITTTYGDKIEVIRGSYKMVVLGRQDNPVDSAGWDLSGQHVQDWGYSMPGASVTLEWVPLYGGTWLQKNSTEIFHSWNRTAGNKKDEYWGDLLENYVGQENPGPSLPQEPPWPGGAPNPCLKNNPVILEKTFALSITSQTGSAVLPVPTIDESTWVTTSTSSTTADTTSDTTTVSGSISESTTAGSISESTTVSDSITSTTEASDTTDTTTVSGAITETTSAGTITGITTAGAITEVTTAGASTSVDVVGLQTSVFVGALGVDVALAGSLIDVSIATGISVTLGPRVEIQIPDATEISLDDIKTFLSEVKTGLQLARAILTNDQVALSHTMQGMLVQLGLAFGP